MEQLLAVTIFKAALKHARKLVIHFTKTTISNLTLICLNLNTMIFPSNKITTPASQKVPKRLSSNKKYLICLLLIKRNCINAKKINLNISIISQILEDKFRIKMLNPMKHLLLKQGSARLFINPLLAL